MENLFSHAFSGVNAFYSVLLIGAMLYWLGMIAGIFHLGNEAADAHDADLDTDLDADIHVDSHADGHDAAHLHHETETGFWYDLTHFFWPGKTPLTVGLSLLAIAWWTLSMALTWIFNPQRTVGTDLLLQIPVIAAGFFVLKYFGMPIGLLMEQLQADTRPTLPGKIGRVVLTVAKGRVGQVEVLANGAPLLMSATTDESEALLPGSQVLVLDYHDENTLLVRAFESSDDK